MKKRPLGNTGINVSEIAFGGVEIGMPYGIGINDISGMPSEKEAVELLHAALDAGINFFDTARVYGNSETIMGKAFKQYREKVIFCTKCRHLPDNEDCFFAYSNLKKFIENSLKESLDALQTDHVELFMLHQANLDLLSNKDIISVFQDLKRKGKILATGISTYSPEETQVAIASGVWDVIQIPFNLMDQRQAAFFSKAKEKGIGLMVRSVLMKGLLTNRSINLHPALNDVERHIKVYEKMQKATNFSLPLLATKFALSFNEVSSVLVGIDRKKYLKQSLEAANGMYLENEIMQEVKKMAYPNADFLNLNHWSKMNWLK